MSVLEEIPGKPALHAYPTETSRTPFALKRDYQADLEERLEINLDEYESEGELWHSEMVPLARYALLSAIGSSHPPPCWPVIPLGDHTLPDLANILIAKEPSKDPLPLQRAACGYAPEIAQLHVPAIRSLASLAWVVLNPRLHIPAEAALREVERYFECASYETPSWTGRRIAWTHAYEAPMDLQELERLRQTMLLVARRATRQAPLSLVLLCHTNPLCEELIQEMVAADFAVHTSQRCHPPYFEAAETSETPVLATPSGKLAVFLYQRQEGTSLTPTECHLQECYDVETRKREQEELIKLAASCR